MRETEIITKCPFCSEVCNRTLDPFGQTRPTPGDLSICAYCLGLGRFDENLRLTKVENIRDLQTEMRKEIENIRTQMKGRKND